MEVHIYCMCDALINMCHVRCTCVIYVMYMYAKYILRNVCVCVCIYIYIYIYICVCVCVCVCV